MIDCTVDYYMVLNYTFNSGLTGAGKGKKMNAMTATYLVIIPLGGLKISDFCCVIVVHG